MANAGIVARPRLVQLMAQRWNQRVIAVVAGPGFGKSTLIAHVVSENKLAPRGDDVVIECTRADRSPGHFANKLAMEIASGGRCAPTVGDLIAALGVWPRDLCLVIDDVDHLVSTCDGAALLAHLIEHAPPSVHFLLTSRRPVRGLARLRVTGQLVEIGEKDLALSPAEAADMAAAHQVGAEVVATAGGWPAVAALAATHGIVGATNYVWEAVVDHLDDEDRRILAVAATIGPCDARLLAAAVGDTSADPVEVLMRVPLVSGFESDQFEVDDLWSRIVGDSLSDDERVSSVDRAVDELTSRRDYVGAFALCATHELWSAAARVVNASCELGFPPVPPAVLASWLHALPRVRWEKPEGLLLRGLVARFHDSFRPSTVDCLERAASAYRDLGHVGGEIAATSALAYVLRSQGDAEAIPTMMRRVVELDASGHRAVEGLMALMRSFVAELAGDDTLMLAELDHAPSGSLSREWQAVVAFRQVIGHLTLGNEQPMLAAATRCAELAGDATLRHALPLARWFAGDPHPAIDACPAIVADAAHSSVDAVALGAFSTMVLATSGRLDEACAQLEFTERAAAGGKLLPLMQGYLIGVRALVAAAQGDDAQARAGLEAALAASSLSTIEGWRMASRWLPLAYVLVPGARAELDTRELAPIHRRRIAVARAVAAVHGAPLPAAGLEDVTPQLVATTVPLRWAMTLASRLAREGTALGMQIASYLFDLHGARARGALRDVGDHGPSVIAAGARKMLSSLTLTPTSCVRLRILGPTVLEIDGVERCDIDWRRERVRTLLLFLVVNGPSRREQITDVLWPDLEPEAADRNLRVTLSYLHRVLEPDRRTGEPPFFVRDIGSNLTLAGAPHFVVDADEFEAAVARAEEADRHGVPSVALTQHERALSLWRGCCLGDVAYEEWAEPRRRALISRFVRAAIRAGEMRLASGDTAAARRHARHALLADQWSEAAHRLLIVAALDDGDRSTAARALADCDAMLDDLGVVASDPTEKLRQRVARPSLGTELRLAASSPGER